MLDSKVKEEIHQYVKAQLSQEEEVNDAWSVLSKLEPLDQLKLMFYITKRASQITDTELFVRFANQPWCMGAMVGQMT